MVSPISGGYGVGETPLPIPNRAVKPHSADGTWPFGPGRVGRRRFTFAKGRPTGRPFVRFRAVGPRGFRSLACGRGGGRRGRGPGPRAVCVRAGQTDAAARDRCAGRPAAARGGLRCASRARSPPTQSGGSWRPPTEAAAASVAPGRATGSTTADGAGALASAAPMRLQAIGAAGAPEQSPGAERQGRAAVGGRLLSGAGLRWRSGATRAGTGPRRAGVNTRRGAGALASATPTQLQAIAVTGAQSRPRRWVAGGVLRWPRRWVAGGVLRRPRRWVAGGVLRRPRRGAAGGVLRRLAGGAQASRLRPLAAADEGRPRRGPAPALSAPGSTSAARGSAGGAGAEKGRGARLGRRNGGARPAPGACDMRGAAVWMPRVRRRGSGRLEAQCVERDEREEQVGGAAQPRAALVCGVRRRGHVAGGVGVRRGTAAGVVPEALGAGEHVFAERRRGRGRHGGAAGRQPSAFPMATRFVVQARLQAAVRPRALRRSSRVRTRRRSSCARARRPRR